MKSVLWYVVAILAILLAVAVDSAIVVLVFWLINLIFGTSFHLLSVWLAACLTNLVNIVRKTVEKLNE